MGNRRQETGDEGTEQQETGAVRPPPAVLLSAESIIAVKLII